MRRISVALLIFVSILAVLSMRERAAAQGDELATGKITHIGVVVRDMDAALRQYTRVMGFAMPQVGTHPIPVPDGRNAEFKLAVLSMPNFFIELIQPVNAVGPYHDHLQNYGVSIQHVGLTISGAGSVDALRAKLEQKGGRWSLGAAGYTFAYVNFQPLLGTTLEVIRSGPGNPGALASPPAGDALPPLGALKVTHVGFAVTDASAVATRFSDVLGTTAPRVIDYKDSQYPPDATWNRSAFVRLAVWNQGGMGVELIESVGSPTPWSEFVARQKGPSAQHFAIDVGNRMDETIADLVAKGGKWTNGKPGGNYAYLDFMDTLGVIFELNGTSKSAPPVK